MEPVTVTLSPALARRLSLLGELFERENPGHRLTVGESLEMLLETDAAWQLLPLGRGVRAWVGPEGKRYQVEIFGEPLIGGRSIAFRREDGWLGVTAAPEGLDALSATDGELRDLLAGCG